MWTPSKHARVRTYLTVSWLPNAVQTYLQSEMLFRACMQVLDRVSIALAISSAVLVLVIFIVLTARGDGVGYAVVICFVVFVSVVPVRPASTDSRRKVRALLLQRAAEAFHCPHVPYPDLLEDGLLCGD